MLGTRGERETESFRNSTFGLTYAPTSYHLKRLSPFRARTGWVEAITLDLSVTAATVTFTGNETDFDPHLTIMKALFGAFIFFEW